MNIKKHIFLPIMVILPLFSIASGNRKKQHRFELTDTIKSYQPYFKNTHFDEHRSKKDTANGIQYDYDLNPTVKIRMRIISDSTEKANTKQTSKEYFKINRHDHDIYISFLINNEISELAPIFELCPQIFTFLTLYHPFDGGMFNQSHFSFNDGHFYIEKGNFLLKINERMKTERKLMLYDKPEKPFLGLYWSINMIQQNENTLITGSYVPMYPPVQSYSLITVVDLKSFKVKQSIKHQGFTEFTVINNSLFVKLYNEGNFIFLKYE